MATQTTNYGTRAAYPNVSNLNSLPSGQACCVGAIDNTTTKAIGGKIDLVLTCAGTPVINTSIAVYLIQSGDGTTYTDGISPTATATAALGLNQATLIRTLKAIATAGYVFRDTFDLPVDFCPLKHTLAFASTLGVALAATGADVQWTPIKLDIA